MNIVNAEYSALPSPLGPMVVVAALTQDDAGKFAVYASIQPDLSLDDKDGSKRRKQAEWAAYNGAKLSCYEAKQRYFPFLKAEEYRS